MRTILHVVLILLFVGLTALVSAQSAAKELNYTSRAIARKVRNAKTAQDFEEIARFYDKQAKEFWALAAEQRHEKDYYNTHDGGKQYPLASERARQLRDYYDQRAKESDVLATKYRERAGSLAPAAADQAAGMGLAPHTTK